MTDADEIMGSVLRSVTPRPGFAVELLAALSGQPAVVQVMTRQDHLQHVRWVVAGAVAGVFTAGGAVVWGLKRHRGAA